MKGKALLLSVFALFSLQAQGSCWPLDYNSDGAPRQYSLTISRIGESVCFDINVNNENPSIAVFNDAADNGQSFSVKLVEDNGGPYTLWDTTVTDKLGAATLNRQFTGPMTLTVTNLVDDTNQVGVTFRGTDFDGDPDMIIVVTAEYVSSQGSSGGCETFGCQ